VPSADPGLLAPPGPSRAPAGEAADAPALAGPEGVAEPRGPSGKEGASRQTAAGRRRGAETKERIVEVASALFAERGYGGTSIAEVERAAGLTPGSGGLYRHFASKDELLAEVVLSYTGRVRELRRSLGARHCEEGVGAMRSEQAAREALTRVLASLGEFLLGEQAMVRIGADSASLPDSARSALGEAWDEGYGIFADLFARFGRTREEAAEAALLALGSLAHYFDHLSSWRREPLSVGLDRFARRWLEQWSRWLAQGTSFTVP
jgi:AcrR family transcriptional regulator